MSILGLKIELKKGFNKKKKKKNRIICTVAKVKIELVAGQDDYYK